MGYLFTRYIIFLSSVVVVFTGFFSKGKLTCLFYNLLFDDGIKRIVAPCLSIRMINYRSQ